MSTLELEHIKHTSSSSNNLSVHSDGSLTVGNFQSLNVLGRVGIGTVTPASAGLDVTKAGGGNFVAQFTNTTAATPYGVWIKEPSSAANGYPSLQVTDNAGTGTLFRVDSGTGYVTVPNQPAFSAYQTSNYSTTGGVSLTWTATQTNRGNCFNTSNGTFTVPITGVYCFQFYQLTQANTSSGDVRIRVNGSVVDGHYGYGINGTGAHKQATISCVLELSTNDTVKITSHGNNDWNDRHGGFSGFLIG